MEVEPTYVIGRERTVIRNHVIKHSVEVAI